MDTAEILGVIHPSDLKIPQEFFEATIVREGDEGKVWLDNLGAVVAELCTKWDLKIEGPVLHGYLAIVIPVLQNQDKAALKISWLDEDTVDEGRALEAWKGQGAVELIDSDPSLGALLLERLDYSTNLESLDPDTATKEAGRLLRRLAIPAPFWARKLDDQIGDIASMIEKRFASLDHNMSRALYDHSLGLLDELRNSDNDLLVNQDLHFQNVLAGTREDWIVIDPKVVAGDLEYGTAQLFWQDFGSLNSANEFSRRVGILADAAQLDKRKMERWILIRLVEMWLWGVELGFTEIPRRCESLISYID